MMNVALQDLTPFFPLQPCPIEIAPLQKRTPQADTAKRRLLKPLIFTTLRSVELSKLKSFHLPMIELKNYDQCCFTRPDPVLSVTPFFPDARRSRAPLNSTLGNTETKS